MFYKIEKIRDIDEFCTCIDDCTGKIELWTEDGDRLNLRSELSRLISVNIILMEAVQIEGIKLFIESSEDVELFRDCIDIVKDDSCAAVQ